MTEATSYRPAQRRVAARVLTPAGWLTGHFHVPEARPLVSFLNGTSDFFTLTHVRLPGQSADLEFLALQRSAALFVIPGDDPLVEASDTHPEPPRSAQISCLLESGMLTGTLRIPPNLRVSDQLIRQAGFLALRDCTIALDQPQGVEAASVVVVNAARVVGVAEI